MLINFIDFQFISDKNLKSYLVHILNTFKVNYSIKFKVDDSSSLNEFIFALNNILKDNLKLKKIIVEELEEHFNISCRVCSNCNSIMLEGYCIEDGTEYYCSDRCLLENMSYNQFLSLYDEGNGDSYWTEWN